MKILVTGVSGFIGSALVRKLVVEGHEVTALMRKTSSHRNLHGVSFQKAIGDLSQPSSLSSAVKGMEVIVHLAGCVSAAKKSEFTLHNTLGTKNLAEAVDRHGQSVRHFIFVSS